MVNSNKVKENNLVIKIFLIPTLFVAFILTFIVEELRTVGILYMVMDAFALFIFSQKKYQEEVIGIKSQFVAPLFVGVGTAVAFLILKRLSPAFSLLTPAIALSVAENLRFFVIVILAPVAEECWRSSVIGLIEDTYNLKKRFWITNSVQGSIFAMIHILIYGVVLGAYDSWVQVYGAVAFISGALFAAFLFGIVSGYLMRKFQNVTPSLVSHLTINFYLYSVGLIVLS